MISTFIRRAGALITVIVCIVVYAFVAQAAVAQMSGPRREKVSVAVTTQSGAQHSQDVALPGSQTLKANLVETYGKLPLVFEANQGQSDPQVKFISRGAGYSLFLTPTEAVLELSPNTSPSQSNAATIRMTLLNASTKTEVSGQQELLGTSNYFRGNDPTKWHTNVRQFAKVRYADIYPGVDLVYYGRQRELEYDFVVRPGANPDLIRLNVEGTTRLRIERGDLVLSTSAGAMRLLRPHVYQVVSGSKRKVQGRYLLIGKNEVGFRLASYDRSRALIIDPVLVYSTYMGGTGHDFIGGIAVDAAGNAYVTGATDSTDFPQANALQATNHGHGDAFVTKINADGTALVYSTYLGGSQNDYGSRIAVDKMGNVYVKGYTDSSDFPSASPIPPGPFVAKINAEGNTLVFSTYLGGGYVGEIAVDAAGNAYVYETGMSEGDFPTCSGRCAFVTKVKASSASLVYAIYWEPEGGYNVVISGIAADAAGNAYVTGSMEVARGGAAIDGFVAKVDASGSDLVYSTSFDGGNSDTEIYPTNIAADAAGNAYVTGYTVPICVPGEYCQRGRSIDAWVKKLDANGHTIYSKSLGGNDEDRPSSIAADGAGNAYVTGNTRSTNFPRAHAIQSTIGGWVDAFVTKLNTSGVVAFSTYLGGNRDDVSSAIAVDAAGSAYVVGVTRSWDFTKTPLAFQQSPRGVDTFITKIASRTFVNVTPQRLNFGFGPLGITSPSKQISITNNAGKALTLNQLYLAGPNSADFAENNTCPASLAAKATCDVWVTFTPTTKGLKKGVLAISDSDRASPHAVTLSGIGTMLSATPQTLSFGRQPVETISAVRTTILTNTGTADLHIDITITGMNAGDFGLTTTCGRAIVSGASCTVSATFQPTSTGTRRATISVRNDGTLPGGTTERPIQVTGTGT